MKKNTYHILLYTMDLLLFGLFFFCADFSADFLFSLPLYFLISYVLGLYNFKIIALVNYLFFNIFAFFIFGFFIFLAKKFFHFQIIIPLKTFFLNIFGIFFVYKIIAYEFLRFIRKKRKTKILFLYDSSLIRRIDYLYLQLLKKTPFYKLQQIIDLSRQKIPDMTDSKKRIVVEDNLFDKKYSSLPEFFSEQGIIFSEFVEQNFNKVFVGKGVYHAKITNMEQGRDFYFRVHNVFQMILNIVFIGFLLPILSFFILIIPIFNIFFNKGPLFYKQKRVGIFNKEFYIYKFRTMVSDAESHGVQMATKKDSRITPFGKILRKLRVDELPQIISVLRGHMNFIGPRPERLFFVKKIQAENSLYNFRHNIKPGITGWAQVQYQYGLDVSDSIRKLEYDLYYLKHRSIILDIRIILKTVQTVLSFGGV